MQLNPPLTMNMYESFGNFKRIIGEIIKNNRILFWEIQNRIVGNILGIICSGLVISKTITNSILDNFKTGLLLNYARVTFLTRIIKNISNKNGR